jgi:hypothetical protein
MPSRETSTTEGSPVRSRLNRAAAMPEASANPPRMSPKAGRCIGGHSMFCSISMWATPPREK